jgi:hypothetical protein
VTNCGGLFLPFASNPTFSSWYHFVTASQISDTKKPPSGGHDITTYCFVILEFIFLVPGAGLEPAQP